jgi:hypothetical protein
MQPNSIRELARWTSTISFLLRISADLPSLLVTFSVYRAKPDSESFDDFLRGDPTVQKQVFDQWNINGTGPLATNGIEAGVKIRPTEEELVQMDSWPWYVFRKTSLPILTIF